MNGYDKRKELEEQFLEEPILEYAFLRTTDIKFEERVRMICRQECPRYGKSWSCPPAVGTVEECRQRVMKFRDVFVFSTVTQVPDITDLESTLKTRIEHEKITRRITALFQRYYGKTLTLSTESCAICAHCTYPDAPCRHPDRMYPAVESYGILVTDLAEKADMGFDNGENVATWFSLIFYNAV